MRIWPLVGLRSASIMSSDVDLPAPLGPSRATVSPRRSCSDSPSTARTAPYTLLTSSNETIGVPSAAVSPELIGPSILIVIPRLVRKV